MVEMAKGQNVERQNFERLWSAFAPKRVLFSTNQRSSNTIQRKWPKAEFAILTLRYFNVRYFEPFEIVADKYISYSLFSISGI